MADTKYEYYNTGWDSYLLVQGVAWVSQTFTASSAHDVSQIKILIFRGSAAMSPGTVTVGIRAVDGSGHPTGSDLTSGTFNGNTVTTDAAGEWISVTLLEYTLASGIQYAIVIRAPNGGPGDYLCWQRDVSSPTFTGGNLEYSIDSGVSWTAYTGSDMMFEVWGVGTVDTPTNVSPADGATEISVVPNLEASAYSGAATHASSRWQVRKAYDADWVSPEYDSGEDTSNLTSIALTAALVAGTDYQFRVRYTNSSETVSEWSTATGFTTGERGILIACKLFNRTLSQKLSNRTLTLKAKSV